MPVAFLWNPLEFFDLFFAKNRKKAKKELTSTPKCAIIPNVELRGVAQFGSALGSGPRGRWFESSHSDHIECS